MVCFQNPVRISGICNVLSVQHHADMTGYLLQLWRPGKALNIHARFGCHVDQFEDLDQSSSRFMKGGVRLFTMEQGSMA